MQIFRDDTDARWRPDEIVAQCRQEFDVELVEGYSGIFDLTGGREYTGRVATFWECTNRNRGWLVSQRGPEWLEWQTAAVPADSACEHAVFVFGMGMGMGSALPQPSGQFDLYLNGDKLLSFCVVKRRERWDGADASLCYDARRVEVARPGQALTLDDVVRDEGCASFGIGLLRVPMRRLVKGQRARIKVVPVNAYPSKRWFRLDGATPIVHKVDFHEAMQTLCAAERGRHQIDGFDVYFGDLHCQSGMGRQGLGSGIGEGTLEANYAYARDVANLDFVAMNEQDYNIVDEADFAGRKAVANAHDEPGRFVTLCALELCCELYGHRNIYCIDDSLPLIRARKDFDPWNEANDHPRELFDKLRPLGDKVFTVPHHVTSASHPFNWACFDPEFDKLVEIYSKWGSAEYSGNPFQGTGADKARALFVDQALRRGHRFGFIASSDSHDGHPGNSQGTPRHVHLYHYLGSGRAAVLAGELTREGIFRALRARRTYATTGEPILIDFRVNGQVPSGEREAPAADSCHLAVRTVGTANMREVQIVRNGQVFASQPGRGREVTVELDARACPGDWYYAKAIQMDYEMAWSSPVWVR